jgi:hypothetical protein
VLAGRRLILAALLAGLAVAGLIVRDVVGFDADDYVRTRERRAREASALGHPVPLSPEARKRHRAIPPSCPDWPTREQLPAADVTRAIADLESTGLLDDFKDMLTVLSHWGYTDYVARYGELSDSEILEPLRADAGLEDRLLLVLHGGRVAAAARARITAAAAGVAAAADRQDQALAPAQRQALRAFWDRHRCLLTMPTIMWMLPEIERKIAETHASRQAIDSR